MSDSALLVSHMAENMCVVSGRGESRQGPFENGHRSVALPGGYPDSDGRDVRIE